MSHAAATTVTLTPEAIAAIAHRVVELLDARDHAIDAERLVDAATLALVLSVDRTWVYDHADELGAIRLGTGDRPRLRFIPDRVAEALAAAAPCGSGRGPGTPAPQAQPGEPARPRRRRTPPGAQSVPQLLPIRGRDA